MVQQVLPFGYMLPGVCGCGAHFPNWRSAGKNRFGVIAAFKPATKTCRSSPLGQSAARVSKFAGESGLRSRRPECALSFSVFPKRYIRPSASEPVKPGGMVSGLAVPEPRPSMQPEHRPQEITRKLSPTALRPASTVLTECTVAFSERGCGDAGSENPGRQRTARQRQCG